MYPFLLEIRHKFLGTISRKHNDASMRMPRSDIRNDTLDVGRRKTGIRCNHQEKVFARCVLKDIGESAIGLHNCHMVALFTKDYLKTGSKYLLFRYDENVANPTTSYRM
jgi:hypothetical protein